MRIVQSRLCACCFLAGFAALASGATLPPPLPFEDLDWSARVHRKPATGLTLGRLTVVFEKTPLSHVLQEAGGVIAESGDAADHTLWLCYTMVDTKHSERIWLTSNGEMDGPAHAISGVIAQNVAEGSKTDCPALPAALRPVSLSDGEWKRTDGNRFSSSLGVARSFRCESARAWRCVRDLRGQLAKSLPDNGWQYEDHTLRRSDGWDGARLLRALWYAAVLPANSFAAHGEYTARTF
jgi:hypothetical protein